MIYPAELIKEPEPDFHFMISRAPETELRDSPYIPPVKATHTYWWFELWKNWYGLNMRFE